MKSFLIALSAGGSDHDLAAQGLGMEHINELMVRMSMRLLKEGHRLSFGGTMGGNDKNLTKSLLHTAQNWTDNDSRPKSKVTVPNTWPMVNYSPWPFHRDVTESDRAQMVGICRFETVDPKVSPGVDLEKAAEDWKDKPQSRLYLADALSRMRNMSAEEADLRIAWGGKIKSVGWLTGVLEEVGCSLQHGKPVVILGGFGGCAGLLAAFLDPERDPHWPEQLSFETCADPPRDALHDPHMRQQARQRFDQAKQSLIDYRSNLDRKLPVNGLSWDLLKSALKAESPTKAVSVASAAVRQLQR